MELKWTLNLIHWSRDKERWVFILEFEDSLSQEVISIEISRKEMAEIFFDNLYKKDPNCKIIIPENVGKQRIRETHRVKMEWYSLEEEDVKKYFAEKWMNYDEWKWFKERSKWSIVFWRDWEPNEQEITIIKYV